MTRLRRARALAAVLALLFVIGCVGAVPAGAADSVSIRKADTTDFPEVRVSVLYTGARPSLEDVSVRENGRLLTDLEVVPLAETETPVGTVLVIDTSGSMRAGNRLEQAKTAARAFVEARLRNDQIALVTFSNEARIAVNFTTEAEPLLTAINALQPAGETALWDGVRVGANLLVERPDLLPYLVVLSDGADTLSTSTAADALGAARGAQAGVFAVAITGPGESDVPALKSLAEQTNGSFAETSDARQLGRLYENVQRVLQNQYELRWTSAAKTSPLDITIKIGTAQVGATAVFNSVSLGSSSAPREVETPALPTPLEEGRGPIVSAVLAAFAMGLGVIGVLFLRKRRPPIDDMLRAYSGAAGPDAARAEPTNRNFVPESVRRAVETTARLAGGGGALERLDTKLDQADLRVRAQEAVLFYAAGVALVSILATLAAGPLIGLSAFVLVALAPIGLLSQLAEHRRGAFTKQLPDTLQLLASSLRAGYSLLQGFDAVTAEVEDPMGRELRRVVLETRLGRDMEASLEELAGRMKSQDFDWVVMAIRIQREVGGNLAELLTSVAETMVSRERLRREVSALTAEGRLSMFICGALPIVIAAAIAVLNPGYLNALFTSTIGRGMILGSVLLTVVGFAWMRKLIQIDV